MGYAGIFEFADGVFCLTDLDQLSIRSTGTNLSLYLLFGKVFHTENVVTFIYFLG